jgi:hypothetical protein
VNKVLLWHSDPVDLLDGEILQKMARKNSPSRSPQTGRRNTQLKTKHM